MSKLLPVREYSEQDVINGFSTVEETLEAGTLVTIASFNPTADAIYQTTKTEDLGSASYVSNPYFITPNKVRTATSGCLAAYVLGMTLNDVAKYDSLGRKLAYDPQRLTERDAVISGQAVPVVRKGMFQVNDKAIAGTPAVNSLAIVGESGKFEAVTYAQLTGKGLTMNNVIGKFMSSTGSCGGYNRSGSNAYIILDV